MPTFQSDTFSNFYKRIFQVNQTSNTGCDTTIRTMESGDGAKSALALSDAQVEVLPQNDNTTTAFNVKNQSGTSIFSVDTTNGVSKSGTENVPTTTLIKEMGIYDFSPTAGYHNPLMAHNMWQPVSSTAYAEDQDWGNGTDPATTLDSSGLTNPYSAIGYMWYIQSAITIDQVRFLASANGDVTMNFHIMSYTLDSSTNHGDLSAGAVCASGTIAAISAGVKTGTLTLDSANIARNKIAIGFVENVTDTNDVTCSLSIRYHIQ